jgi:hypothetical protein
MKYLEYSMIPKQQIENIKEKKSSFSKLFWNEICCYKFMDGNKIVGKLF